MTNRVTDNQSERPAATPKIELSGVRKRFGSKVVLNGVDLSVAKRDSLVVIGGSGSGK